MNNLSLMDSLSINQLKLCEKEHLINYIVELKSLIGAETKGQKKSLLEQFMDESCVPTDCIKQKNGSLIAPTSFGEIFYEYKDWAMCQGHRFDNSKEYKLKIKEDLIKWQEASVYGCFMGDTKQEGEPNGSLKFPLFNLVVNSED
jgi:hypothetical protein